MRESYEDRLGLAAHLRGGDEANFAVGVRQLQVGGGSVLDLPDHGVVLIVGGNNAGKSTLLRQIHQKLSEHWNEPVFSPTLLTSLQVARVGSLADAYAWMGAHVPISSGIPGVGPAFHRFGVQADKSFVENVWNGGLPEGQLGALGPILSTLLGARDRFNAISPLSRRPDAGALPSGPLHEYEDKPALFKELSDYCYSIFGQSLTLDPISGNVVIRYGSLSIAAPPVDAITQEYREAVTSLRPIGEQGDGVASTLGTLVPLVAGQFPIALVDEPEAFLHPPQALKLGRALAEIARLRRAQLFLATHDRNVVAGALSEAATPVTIVRLIRSATSTVAKQVGTDELRAVWSNPVLRYSNAVDGLFHRAVVICENERDGVFYSAALEHLQSQEPLPAGLLAADVLFVASHGLGGVKEIAEVLRAASVPVVVAADLDVVADKSLLQGIVEAVGFDWSQAIDDSYGRATAEFKQQKPVLTRGQVAASIQAVLLAEPEKAYGAADKKAVGTALAVANPWREVKLYGLKAFRAEPIAARTLISALDAAAVILVQVGELENFADELEVSRGRTWLPAALAAEAQKSTAAITFIRRIVAGIVNSEDRLSQN